MIVCTLEYQNIKMQGKISLFFGYLKCMNIQRISNFLLLRISHVLSRFIGKPVHWGRAFAVTFETVAGCNFQCPGCEQGAGLIQRKSGMMDVEDFYIALNKLPSSVFHLNLHFQGEPLLHPDIVKFVRLARQRNMFVSLSTNASLLDEFMADELISAGLSHMIISLDGHDRDSYETYRKGGDFQKVLDNVQYLSQQRRRKHTRFPVIEVQAVVTASNEHHLKKIEQIAHNLGADRYSEKSAYVPDLSFVPSYLPNSQRYTRYMKNEDGSLTPKSASPRFCYRMQSSCVVLHDFRVVPCCFDKNGTIIFGNLQQQEFSEIHKGKIAGQLRAQLADRNGPAICSNCIR